MKRGKLTWFDQEHCAVGVSRLENYSRKWKRMTNTPTLAQHIPAIRAIVEAAEAQGWDTIADLAPILDDARAAQAAITNAIESAQQK